MKSLVEAIETLDEDFYFYRGAEFWANAALTYLRTIVSEKENQENEKNGTFQSLVNNGKMLVKIGLITATAVGLYRVVSRA